MNKKDFWKLAVLGMIAAGLVVVLACGGGSSAQTDTPQASNASGDSTTPAPDAVTQIVNAKMSTVDTTLPLWAIQPGLGTVMIEYNTRMSNAWFAAQAGNWDMVAYQFKEMVEIQEVGETTRPKRVEDLKKFETEQLEPLIQTGVAHDLAAFNEQYPRTLNGCNSCHKKIKDTTFPNGYSFIKIVPPPQAATQDIDWNGQTP
jgi:hypothetical protein